MRRRDLILLGIAGLATAALATGWAAFDSTLRGARARIRSGSLTFRSRAGVTEYAVAGEGSPVLMVHGTGGGFDQGLSFANRLIEGGWEVIAPSRFGYLRSEFPADPSSESQADVFADLLDHLGIDRAPVIGGSAGALSAIQFAIRHRDRCSGLVAMVPATFAPGRPKVVPPSPLAAAIIEHALKSDLAFWTGLTFAEDAMIGALLATDPELVRNAEATERARVRSILRNILPVSERAKGLMNDARLAGDPAPAPLERIRAPTLAISLDDDRFETLAAAQHIANTVPNAKLITFPKGGHVWVGHDEVVFEQIDAFLKGVISVASR